MAPWLLLSKLVYAEWQTWPEDEIATILLAVDALHKRIALLVSEDAEYSDELKDFEDEIKRFGFDVIP